MGKRLEFIFEKLINLLKQINCYFYMRLLNVLKDKHFNQIMQI